MTKTNESGHEKNLANLDVEISTAQGIGEKFLPSNPLLMIDSMLNLRSNCSNAMNAVREAFADFKTAVTARAEAFSKLSKLVTRVSNTLIASGVSSGIIESAKPLFRKLQGRRAKAKMTEDEKQAAIDSGKAVREASASQMSFDNQIGNFSQLIDFLSRQNYAPNEKDLQIESLKAFLTELKQKNAAVVEATTALYNARAKRDELMYKEDTGMVSIAMDFKAYIKGAFGPSSAHFRKVSGLEFRKN